jgi:fatty-acyl-CoA synthase
LIPPTTTTQSSRTQPNRHGDELVAAHPAVAEIAVVSRKHPDYGETVIAFVNPCPGQTVTINELREFGAERLSAHKLPRDLILREIPRNPLGKILKHVLRADLEKSMA